MKKLDLNDYLIGVLDAIAMAPTLEAKDAECLVDKSMSEVIPKKVILDILRAEKNRIDAHNESLPKTYTKIMYVEDGSVDVDELTKILPDTKIIVYRQGACPPELKDISNTPLKGY